MRKPPTTHILKIPRKYFYLIEKGIQKFIIQPDDQNIRPGDILILQEQAYLDTLKLSPTGESITCEVTIPRRGYEGLQRGHVVIGIETMPEMFGEEG